MRSALVPLAAAAAQRRATRTRSTSLSAVPPAETSEDYLPELAEIAASILYRSPLLSREGHQVYILNAAAFPDAFDVDYDSLLSYVLARLPGEDELIAGTEYEIVFFSGGSPDNATAEKKQGPSTGWYLQAYHVLSRATRKKLKKLYIVHPRSWVRMLIIIFGRIVSPKFGKKIEFVNSITALAMHIEIEKLLIPPSAYLQDRKVSPDIYAPFVTGSRAFGARHPLPKSITSGVTRLPRVLRETTTFLLMPSNIIIEGLFRIPPQSVQLGVLKEAYDRGQQFIVWKERDMTYVQPNVKGSYIDEIRVEDAYGVHLAASLIKAWYRDLCEPIFCEASYPQLREKYSDAKVPVSLEDLTDLLLPASQISPLTASSKDILIRHLLPTLSAVASHAHQNKMNAENLGICFSMCLVCGSNQMEDARISIVVKRILQAAIEAWPQLSAGMSIDPEALHNDLQAPKVYQDYEDPLEDERPERMTDELHQQEEVGHRILMHEREDSVSTVPATERASILPPRRSRATSIKDALQPTLEKLHLDSLPSMPKRKPAPPVPEPATLLTDPPRYSTVFDSDGRSVKVLNSPTGVTTAIGFATPSADIDLDQDATDKSLSVVSEPTGLYPALGVPKRRPVSSSHKINQHEISCSISTTATSAQNPNHTAMLARMAAQQAAANLAQRLAVETPRAAQPEKINTIHSAPAEMSSNTMKSCTTVPGETATVFRKPSWPASAMRQTPADIQSLTKPVYASTLPVITHPPSETLSAGSFVLRHRAPSPGLLKRMASMENTPHNDANLPTASQERGLEPRRLNLKKTSVDDLRKLYEERASTASSLKEVLRRGSSSGLGI